jgi:hypothetical protein
MGDEYIAIELRIERFIALFGLIAMLVAGVRWGGRAAAGVAIGAGVCWLNFRWLRHSATAVIRLGLAQAGAENVIVPKSTHAKFLGRLGLLLLSVYAILVWLRLPAAAVVCGLAAVFPAVVLELGYEALRGHQEPTQS